jgi:hypothetical protein
MEQRMTRGLLLTCLLLGIVLVLPGLASRAGQAQVHPDVWAALGKDGEAEVLVVLSRQADTGEARFLSTKESRGRVVYEALRTTARESQRGLRALLDAQGVEYQAFYLVNVLRARVGEGLLRLLAARPEVDPRRIGCAGLSGGGMRTVYLGGLDDRIQVAVAVGFMTTWRDLVLDKNFTHTWMTYVPLLPRDLDFPEIFALRAPGPTMFQHCREDALFSLAEVERADEMIRAVFEAAGAPDRFQSRYYDGGHKFDRAMQADAFAWIDRFLKEAPADPPRRR